MPFAFLPHPGLLFTPQGDLLLCMGSGMLQWCPLELLMGSDISHQTVLYVKALLTLLGLHDHDPLQCQLSTL